MASAINPLTGSSSAASSASSSSSANSIAPTEGVFLNLLVSQIQNQDPLNPSDSTQFVSQLAQFSELEQVIGIRSDTDQLAAAATAAASTTSTTSGTTSGTTTGTTGSGSSSTSGGTPTSTSSTTGS